jgi:hypothetical protein
MGHDALVVNEKLRQFRGERKAFWIYTNCYRIT